MHFVPHEQVTATDFIHADYKLIIFTEISIPPKSRQYGFKFQRQYTRGTFSIYRSQQSLVLFIKKNKVWFWLKRHTNYQRHT